MAAGEAVASGSQAIAEDSLGLGSPGPSVAEGTSAVEDSRPAFAAGGTWAVEDSLAFVVVDT